MSPTENNNRGGRAPKRPNNDINRTLRKTGSTHNSLNNTTRNLSQIPQNRQKLARQRPISADNPKSKMPVHQQDFDDDTDDKEKTKKKGSCLSTVLKTLLALIFICVLGATGAGIGAYMGIIKKAPNLELISVEPNAYTSIIYDKNKVEIDRLHGDENREYVTLEQIPVNMQNAIIAIEDERFYSHNGIDLRGMIRAIYSKITSQRIEGASTITQQLIKNNITKVIRNTIETKLQEQYLAVKYEKMLQKQLGSKKEAKDYILELYLNTIYLNHGYNGVQAASLGYYNKDVSELSLAECAVIAGITNNPSLYTPRLRPEDNKKRQKKILNNMLEQGYITQSEYNKAIVEDVYSNVQKSSQNVNEYGNVVHTYFVDSLFEQISNDLQEKYNMSVVQANNVLYNGGLEIIATIDTQMQKIVDEAYMDESLFPNVNYKIDVTYNVSVEDKNTGQQEHSEYKQFVKSKEEGEKFVANKRAEIEKELPANKSIVADKATYSVQPQSAMVIIDYHTGEVKAIAGGRGDKIINRGFNRAVDSKRQPGSVFKVLAAFAPGIDLGTLTPATVFDDVPYDLNGYKPQNWYKGYRGLSTVREGIRDSMNIVAVKAMVETGIDACYDYLLNFGFTTLEDDNHAATALGGLTHGVTQLEVTAAYGTIANNGEYKRPMFYSKVYDHHGNLLLENAEESKQILKQTSSFLLTNMMKDVVNTSTGTGTKAKFQNSEMPVAGKTGTSQESRDLTFVGYTPYYVAGVWLGYDRYDDIVQNMSSLNQSSHLVLWRTIMEKIHQDLPVIDFEQPEGIVSATICTESGKLAGKICSNDPRGTVKSEYFAEDAQPTEYCNVHRQYTYDTSTGMIASKYCPRSKIRTVTGIVRPVPYNGDVADKKYEIPRAVVNGAVCYVHKGGQATAKPNTNTNVNTAENTEKTTAAENEKPPEAATNSESNDNTEQATTQENNNTPAPDNNQQNNENNNTPAPDNSQQNNNSPAPDNNQQNNNTQNNNNNETPIIEPTVAEIKEEPVMPNNEEVKPVDDFSYMQ